MKKDVRGEIFEDQGRNPALETQSAPELTLGSYGTVCLYQEVGHGAGVATP